MKQKSSYLLIIIIFMGIGFVLIRWDVYNPHQPLISVTTPEPVPTQLPDKLMATTQTSVWKTYTNTKYKYSFRYPLAWSVIDVNDSLSSSGVGPTTSPSLARTIRLGNPGVNLYVDAFYKPSSTSIKDYFSENHWSKEWLDRMQGIDINGYVAIKISSNGMTTYYFDGGETVVSLFLNATQPTTGNISLEQQNLYNQILTSFRFH
jgi:hypothetical protein